LDSRRWYLEAYKEFLLEDKDEERMWVVVFGK
jgi:hypothetical protein